MYENVNLVIRLQSDYNFRSCKREICVRIVAKFWLNINTNKHNIFVCKISVKKLYCHFDVYRNVV